MIVIPCRLPPASSRSCTLGDVRFSPNLYFSEQKFPKNKIRQKQLNLMILTHSILAQSLKILVKNICEPNRLSICIAFGAN